MSPQPQAAVGAPLSRVDGRLKVTGKALYAAEHEVEGPFTQSSSTRASAAVASRRSTALPPKPFRAY